MLSQYPQSAFRGFSGCCRGGGGVSSSCDPNPPCPSAQYRRKQAQSKMPRLSSVVGSDKITQKWAKIRFWLLSAYLSEPGHQTIQKAGAVQCLARSKILPHNPPKEGGTLEPPPLPHNEGGKGVKRRFVGQVAKGWATLTLKRQRGHAARLFVEETRAK